ncbi:NAD(P)/FAD-dependent oxidoreductase [Olivibacter sitiensis]|uniref:NAD(P)/FAD-dependent oxidoreductase n=1 Tax=Olivibacter sitiensis TaxID=376470 RepID=UPI00041BC069|nr:aminoacetone oxidase family FAD-binding enzyme [Olivibacter sitiensis]
MNYDAIIIGAGACGLMCAVQAGYKGKKVLVLERNAKAGAKILISGGGRCNYTNLHTHTSNFITEDADFLQSILDRWTVDDTLQFFASHGVHPQEKTLGQLFPVSNKAKDVLSALTGQMETLGQEIWLNSEVKAVQANNGGFSVTIVRANETITLDVPKVVVASGGLPIAKLGASDFGLRIARQFGLLVVPTQPALVPLTVTGKDAEWFASLSGISVYARVSCGRISFEENILFTHWGLSGPAILQISSYWQPGKSITIDLLPNNSFADLIKAERNDGGKRLLQQLLNDCFPKKLVDALGKYLPLQTKVASLSKADAKQAVQLIHGFEVKPAGTKGYEKAEVMRGGVSTRALDRANLEAKDIPGLYFGGECVDVTGWLGGYNFQWAWASGFVIGNSL